MAVLGAFLIVERDADGHAGVVRPAYIRHVAAVADHVPPRSRDLDTRKRRVSHE
jgi:hypothetical protein